MCGTYPTADALDAGTEISSTYEGRHITVLESEITHPTHADGFVDKGDPVIVGDVIVGVAFASASAATDLIAIDTEGIWVQDVNAADDGGNVAVAAGDELYINTTTCAISKITDAATQRHFGYALGAVDSGNTDTIAVKVHFDPTDTWNIDVAKFYFGDAYDFSMGFDGTQLEVLPVADDTGSTNFGDGTTDADVKIFLGATTQYVCFDVGDHKQYLEDVDLRLGDNDEIEFGDGGDVYVTWDTDSLNILPATDDTGTIEIGNGTVSIDVQIFGSAATSYVLWDNSANQLSVVNAALGADARAVSMRATAATPAMSDGYGAFEKELNVTGLATGAICAETTWVNLGDDATAPSYTFCHNDGIYDGGATLTSAYVSWAKYQCLLSTNPAWCSIWELNFSGANSEIDAIFNVNDATLALGYLEGTPTKAAVGSIPFFSTAGGGIRYIYLYDEADAD